MKKNEINPFQEYLLSWGRVVSYSNGNLSTPQSLKGMTYAIMVFQHAII